MEAVPAILGALNVAMLGWVISELHSVRGEIKDLRGEINGLRDRVSKLEGVVGMITPQGSSEVSQAQLQKALNQFPGFMQ